MTRLKFVGDLPLTWGLLLSLLVCLMSWRFYSRESYDLPRQMKWFLPLLRSSAFFLGIMMLTSPVLHHRKTIGELGKVQIFIDQSKSMSLNDQHLPANRKLKIAEGLGWVTEESINTTLPDLAARLSQIQSEYERVPATWGVQTTEMPVDSEKDRAEDLSPEQVASLKDSISRFQQEIVNFKDELPSHYAQRLESGILTKLSSLQDDESMNVNSVSIFEESIHKLSEIKESLLQDFEQSLATQLNSRADSPAFAITQFDVTSRWRRAVSALEESPSKILEELRKYHDVEVYALKGENSVELIFDSESDEKDQSEENRDVTFAKNTDLTTGILAHQKIDKTSNEVEQAEARESAIVLITDGNHNSGSSPLQMARVFGQQNKQIFGVALGAETPAPDLAIVDIEAPDTIFKSDSVRGSLTLSDSIPAGRSFIAQISHGETILWQEELVSQNTSERRVEFTFPVEELIDAGNEITATDVQQLVQYLKLSAEIVPLAEEAETANNSREIHLGVITESHRILILDGRSRWETRYLRNAYERDEQWSVNTIIAGPGTAQAQLPRGDRADQFPASRDALFEYDLVIFGEISRELFQEQELTWLKEFVELRGGGLIFIDGQRKTLQSYLDSEIDSLIPVEWTDKQHSTLPTQLQLTNAGAEETSLRLLADKQKNREFWTQLPAPHTITGTEALTGAEVLLEAKIGEELPPAMITRRFGAGRILFLAFDETWRWRYKAADEWHQRIWNQLARYVIPRPYAVSDEFVSLDTGQIRYPSGSTVGVRARLLGVDGKPVSDANAEALLWEDGKLVGNVHLAPDEEVPGLYRGTSISLSPGEYEVSMRASGFSDSAFKARSRFIVEENENDELLKTSANYDLLQQMSELSGGTFLKEEELSRLPELLSPLSNGRVVESETILWQSYWWFGMIIALLTLEWILRKRFGLL